VPPNSSAPDPARPPHPLAWLDAHAARRRDAGLRRELRPRPADEHVTDLAGNDYLGLSKDPRVVQGAVDAVRRWGAGSTGSRLVTGTTALHAELEAELAAFCGAEAALVFSSGYAANLGVITALAAPGVAGPGALVVSDGANHASLVDACRLSRARIAVVPHTRDGAFDLAAVDAALAARSEARALVVVDSVNSVDGGLAPLAELHAVCRARGALLVVDEAHGLGVLGKSGRGAAEQSGVLDRVDAVTVALSKSLASIGGAIMTSRAAAEGIRASAMPYVFSAANDPASVAAALAALRILRDEPERVARLQDNCALLRRVLAENGAAPIPGEAAVIAVPTGPDEVTGPAWRLAFAAGVYTNAVTYPAVPRGRGVLRLTLMATHTAEQLHRAGEIIAESVATARAAAPAVA
jgi:8-amino-7-oxononanoate synthase